MISSLTHDFEEIKVSSITELVSFYELIWMHTITVYIEAIYKVMELKKEKLE
jgi:hypothetical protein